MLSTNIGKRIKIISQLKLSMRHSPYPHTSVLTQEILSFFEGVHLRILVDATVGAGGHALALLEAHPEIETLVAIDQDPAALEIARRRLEAWGIKVKFFQANFSRLQELLRSQHIDQIDGLLLDLGVSSMQLDQGERGFSFMHDAPLDMRMDPAGELTARDIVNSWDERDLGRIFREYGEEKQWRSAARAIVQARASKTIETTGELVNLLAPILSKHKKKGIHPLTLVFQALRLAVNGELEALERVLPLAIGSLRKGGRLAVISFHSLEDRIVKQLFAQKALDKASTSGLAGLFVAVQPHVKILTKRPFVAGVEEVRQNPRSRSAKLRVVERI